MARVFARLFTGLALIALGFLGSRLMPTVRKSEERPFAVPREYRFLYDGGPAESDIPSLRRNISVDRIVLERSPCYGTCPAYRLELDRSGLAEYEGRAFTTRQGTYRAAVSLGTFATLAFSLERVGFYDLRANYEANWTDDATTTLTVYLTSGREVRVSDYGRQAPPEFWLVSEAMDRIAGTLEWAPGQGPQPRP